MTRSIQRMEKQKTGEMEKNDFYKIWMTFQIQFTGAMYKLLKYMYRIKYMKMSDERDCQVCTGSK